MKRTRIPNQPVHQSNFGLVAWLENTRVALPLKGVECRFEVTGAMACVELDQIYHQNTDRALDCTYTFPLPAGAAVYRCELHVNGRVIRAKVEEKKAALRIFKEQKAAGRRVALVETERENLFTLSLGNVQPGDMIVVCFAWFQVLDRAGEGLRLLVPTCPGVRYIPGKPLLRSLSGRGTVDDTDQVPDASRITPPRIDAMHPDAAYFSLEGRLFSADVESGTASSPSHPIYVRENAGTVNVQLSGHGAVPDRDFVLAWCEPSAKQLVPQSWRWTEGNATYALVQLRAPEGVKVADAFPQDFYFLVDRSGSMEGAKWQRTCQAVRAFVGLLGPEDRVWITLFESDYRDFAEAPVPAPGVLADRGFQRMEALGTAGGTELLPAALHVLKQISKHSATNRASVVLITDGEVGNDEEIVRAFRQAPAVRVHTFGIDTAVNDAFLKALAHQQRGGCWLQTPDDDIAGTIAALGDRLRRPVLTDLSVRGSWEAGRATWPDLHAREVVTVTLRGDAAIPLEITGRFPDGSEHRFTVDLGTVGSEAVKLLWAKERIATLLASSRQPEAIVLARQHNLICEGAAFIAWDEAEQVPIAREELVQPAVMPSKMKALMPPNVPYCMGDHHALSCAMPSRSLQRKADRESFGDFMKAGVPEDLAQLTPTIVTMLQEMFDRAGVTASQVEGLVAWAQSDSAEAKDRLNALLEAAELITAMRAELDSPVLRDRLEACIRQALSGSPKALLNWADETRATLHQIIALQQKLIAAETPKELVDYLIAWVLETGTCDGDRLEKLALFAESLDRGPFSTGSETRRWRALLDLTVGVESKAYSVACQWLPELAAVTRESSAPRSKTVHATAQ